MPKDDFDFDYLDSIGYDDGDDDCDHDPDAHYGFQPYKIVTGKLLKVLCVVCLNYTL